MNITDDKTEEQIHHILFPCYIHCYSIIKNTEKWLINTMIIWIYILFCKKADQSACNRPSWNSSPQNNDYTNKSQYSF